MTRRVRLTSGDHSHPHPPPQSAIDRMIDRVSGVPAPPAHYRKARKLKPSQVWDTAVWNRLEREWVREGRNLTRAQAERRYSRRATNSPKAEFKIVKVR